MIYENDFLNNLNIVYSNVLSTSDSERQRLHQDMACFYYNDYEYPVKGVSKTEVRRNFDN